MLSDSTLSWCLRACRRAPWGAAWPARRPRRECPSARRFDARPGRGPVPTKSSLPISHAIPPQLFQTLNSQRWNCNVLRRSRKMTVGNYLRHCPVRFGSGSPRAGARCAVCCAGLVRLSCSPRVPLPLDPLSISHAIPSRLFQTLNSQRWNCNVLRRSRKVTVGNYLRHCPVRFGPAVAQAVLALVCGARCVVSGVWCSVFGERCTVCDSWAG